MVTGIIGRKINQTQKFLEDGTRIPVTVVSVGSLPVVSVKTADKNGYWALQVAIGSKKKGTKAMVGHIKGAKLEKAPRFLREIRLDKKQTDLSEDQLPKVGDTIKASDVLKPGDIVDVAGTSKGKGYAGVVKRHGFRGGPRTHGQSDRERAPGSIGQTTTPGRVYKGKRMSGRMGQDKKTLRNLKIVDVLDSEVLIKGLVPGALDSLVVITKVGEDKKFVPMLQAKKEEPIVEEIAPETPTEEPPVAAEPQEETKTEEVETKEEAQNAES